MGGRGRFESLFARLSGQGAKAFMPFVTAADPTPEATIETVAALEEAGADAVELGVAYSDPLADGPVIQDSYNRVLSAGYGVEDFFAVTRGIRAHCEIPMAAMVSYSILARRGPGEFADEAKASGVDALIVPDLPPEEATELLAAAGEDLPVVFLATPTTSDERLREITTLSRPFIYYVSVVGITGARAKLPEEVERGIKRVKETTATPVVVGFGVSNPETARRMAGVADGVIVGSAIVKVIAQNAMGSATEVAQAVIRFARPIAEAVKSL